MKRSARRSISPQERLQLVGLYTLARHHEAALKEISDAARNITRETADGQLIETNGGGLTEEAVYNDTPPVQAADTVIRGLGLKVAKPPKGGSNASRKA